MAGEVRAGGLAHTIACRRGEVGHFPLIFGPVTLKTPVSQPPPKQGGVATCKQLYGLADPGGPGEERRPLEVLWDEGEDYEIKKSRLSPERTDRLQARLS